MVMCDFFECRDEGDYAQCHTKMTELLLLKEMKKMKVLNVYVINKNDKIKPLKNIRLSKRVLKKYAQKKSLLCVEYKDKRNKWYTEYVEISGYKKPRSIIKKPG